MEDEPRVDQEVRVPASLAGAACEIDATVEVVEPGLDAMRLSAPPAVGGDVDDPLALERAPDRVVHDTSLAHAQRPPRRIAGRRERPSVDVGPRSSRRSDTACRTGGSDASA